MHLPELASGIVTRFIIGCIHFYQRFISPFTGASCRFYPSCSEYSLRAFNKYGLFFGIIKTIIRLAKCHPLHPGGYDPVR